MKNPSFINQALPVGDLPPGSICLANEGAFDDSYYDEPLTNYLVGGWDQDPLAELLEFFAPAVPVPRRFTYKTFNHSQEFLVSNNDDDIRAIGADFGEVQPETKNEVEARVPNKGLRISVDVDEMKGDPNVEQRRIMRVRKMLMRRELQRAINLLLAADTNNAKTWDASAGKDPDQDVSSDLLTGENLVGVRNNRIAYGSVAWSKRQLSHRAQDNAGGYASASWTPEQLAAFLNVEALSFAEVRYRSAVSTLTTLVGNIVMMFKASAGLSEEDPSNIKRFVSSVDGGGIGRVYRNQVNAKRIELTVEHYSLPVITSTLGIRSLTIS